MGENLQPSPDIDIATRNLRRTNEDMSTVAPRTIDPDRVLARVSRRGIERDLTTLAAVQSVGRPSRLIPSVLEALGDLGNGRSWKQRKREEGGLTEHVCSKEVELLVL
jgi:hypothetical protein